MSVSVFVALVRSFYLICTTAILTARLISPLRQRFLAYGARAQQARGGEDGKGSARGSEPLSQTLDWLSTLDVPHGWFTHFYVISVASSLAWFLLFTFSDKMPTIATQYVSAVVSIRPVQKTTVCVLLMAVQGVRRLYESALLFKPSKSRMWVGHYLFGLAFYVVTNIAIWVETVESNTSDDNLLHDEILALLSLRTCVGLVLFGMASYAQHSAHVYLAGLKKYTVPEQYLFRKLVAPHYTAECIIYFSIAIVGAPQHHVLNHTLMCVVLLTTINLGITAEGTRIWMLGKFRERSEDIYRRWCLIPGIW